MFKIVFSWASKICTVLEYIIAPPVCYSCRSFINQRSILCQNCDVQILSIAPKTFKINSKYIMSVHAISRYNDPLKSLVLAKHRSDHIVIEGLADLMWDKTVLPLLNVDCFIPIPLHWSRKMKRGFNQAELIAKRLAKYKNAPMFDLLNRVKKTEYQARLEQADRQGNVKNAFEIKKGSINLQGKHIVLVDDLCTTGSTAIEVAKVIARLNPISITLIVACRSK